MSPTTPKINTSSLPTNLPAASSSSSSNDGGGGGGSGKVLSSNTTAMLTAALLSANSIPRIETALSQELAAAGWTENLRAYITHLIRSGECSTYRECMAKVMDVLSGREKVVIGSLESGIVVPKEAIREGIAAVRSELEKICDLRVDDVDD